MGRSSSSSSTITYVISEEEESKWPNLNLLLAVCVRSPPTIDPRMGPDGPLIFGPLYLYGYPGYILTGRKVLPIS